MSDTTAADTGELEKAPDSSAGEAEELRALLQRERADFLNYKRRVVHERDEERERTRAELLTAFLPLLDDLDLALAQVPEDLAEHPWAQGVLLGRRRLLDFLTSIGVEPIGTEEEPFEPTYHQALFYEERPGIDERRVANVIRPGYRMGQRVLRPAQVGVIGPTAGDETQEAVGGPNGDIRTTGSGNEQSRAEEVGDGQSHRHRSGNDELGGGGALRGRTGDS